jgi:hypothetical protein
MKSRTSATLRVRAICEYTILRLFMIMFSFLAAMFPFLPGFLKIIGKRMEPSISY